MGFDRWKIRVVFYYIFSYGISVESSNLLLSKKEVKL